MALKLLATGSAGFIGFHAAQEFLRRGWSVVGVEPRLEMAPMQPGDVFATYASIEKPNTAVGYEPTTTIREGIPIFAEWYRGYHGLRGPAATAA